MDLPPLIVATEFPPNASGGGPTIVRQMLHGYPADRITWWCGRPELASATHQMQVGELTGCLIPDKLYPNRRATRLRAWMVENLWGPAAARNLRALLAKKPAASIWTIPHNFSIFPLAAVLGKGGRAYHMSLHDYPGIHEQPVQLGAARCDRLSAQVDLLYQKANTRDAICRPMLQDLHDRLGVEKQWVLHAGLEQAELESLEQRCAKASAASATAPGDIRIIHAGTILSPKTFAIFAAALKIARSRLPRRVTLELYGSHRYAHLPWFEPEWMIEHGEIAQADLIRAMADCTWGFCPMQLADEDPRYNRFSLPTKFTTYITAGLPVLGIGHPTCSMASLMREYAAGFCTGTAEPEALAPELTAALAEENPAQRYAPEILRCAREEFNAAAKRSALWAELKSQQDSRKAATSA